MRTNTHQQKISPSFSAPLSEPYLLSSPSISICGSFCNASTSNSSANTSALNPNNILSFTDFISNFSSFNSNNMSSNNATDNSINVGNGGKKNGANQMRNFGKKRKIHAWTQQEDKLLLDAIEKFGMEKWSLIAEYVGHGRSRSQCSQRWVRCLNPEIVKTPWTTEEDQILLDLVNKLGVKSWTKVASNLDHRSDVQCRYRYRLLLRNNNSISGNCCNNIVYNENLKEEEQQAPALPKPRLLFPSIHTLLNV